MERTEARIAFGPAIGFDRPRQNRNTMNAQRFVIGTPVRRKAQPDAVGLIRDSGYLQEATGDWIYRVQFGNAMRGVPDSELEPLPEYADPWDDVRAGVFGGARAFRTLMTFERLRRPPSPIAASFGSAKAAFYPFQFKPLLKFLENPRKRLLIADDVGLGKTVEAGYIMRELKSQAAIDRVLLVVPSRLTKKWQAEMERRFGERFDIVRSQDLTRWFRQIENRELGRFAWIVSIESARRPEVVDFLADMRPSLDLVVVDEAHRMRNPQTSQHRLGKALSASADHMLMLTATPVQTSLDNLYQLLNILDESEFRDATIFEQQCEANRPVIRAATAIRSNPPRTDDAVESLESMAANPLTQALTESPYFVNLLSRCRQASGLDREGLVELQRDINELSLTGKVVSRTRKADVMPERTVRKSSTLKFRYSDKERAFYDSVAELCEAARPDLSGWGQAMAALMAFRAAASCIPAAAEVFRQRLASDRSIIHRLAHDFDESDEDYDVLRTIDHRIKEKQDNIAATLQQLTDADTKYEDFRARLQELWSKSSSSPKVVIFSFFKPTLRYLKRCLTRDGIDCQLISGDVAIPEREARIEDFANNPQIGVLLSSEVGSEGLDLQFASVVVNYDFPWNPMVVEQRIGRIDRIGQASPTITILNLVAADTIEERILLRLYERIGIFEDSIGEIDPILGETVDKLALEALRGDLSEEDQTAKADQSAAAMTGQRLHAEQLADTADSLMAADQSFLDEIEGLIGGRRVPSETELYEYVSGFLAARFHGSRFPQSVLTRVTDIRAPRGVGKLVLEACAGDGEGTRFGRTLETGSVRATFDQGEALKHASSELLHARHPLLKMVTAEREHQASGMARTFALRLKPKDLRDSASGMLGDYAFEVHLFQSSGVRPRDVLVPLFVDEHGSLLDASVSEDLFLTLLDAATSLEPRPHLERDLVDELADHLRGHLAGTRQRQMDRANELDMIRRERIRITLTGALDHRVAEARSRLDNLIGKGAARFAITMAEAKLSRAEIERDSSLDALGSTHGSVLETELLAVGLLQIGCDG
ncbi:MAG: hypothetical protein F4Y26_02605 [Gammaproteobacteria bacterium]|nr:hypothetical protein [Gammaproteobacteria bacterium]